MKKRHLFIISDGTGITAEALSHSLISQFEGIQFEKTTVPYVDSLDKAKQVVNDINTIFEKTKQMPLIFATLVNPAIRDCIEESNGQLFDLFKTFLGPIEQALDIKSSYTVGKTHGMADIKSYDTRIDAVNYTLSHDDGIKVKNYDKADIVIVGVSRCGKTPTCLYMALQFGILAANYPFTDDDLSQMRLPACLQPFRQKLFGLTINPERLHQIRTERRAGSQYASMEQCRREINEVETLFRHLAIPFFNSTHYSIEELATRIMAGASIERRVS